MATLIGVYQELRGFLQASMIEKFLKNSLNNQLAVFHSVLATLRFGSLVMSFRGQQTRSGIFTPDVLCFCFILFEILVTIKTSC